MLWRTCSSFSWVANHERVLLPGISVEAAASFSWPQRIGMGMGMDLILTGRRATARELYAVGGVQRVFPDSEFKKGVSAFVDELASQSAVAMLEAKHITKEPWRMMANNAIARESVFQYERAAINARGGGANAGFAARAKELEEKKKGKL